MLKTVTPRDWGAFVVSLIILSFFGSYESAVLFFKVPKDDNLVMYLQSLVVLVAGYWIGSSNSSQKKDDVIAQNADNTAVALTTTPPNHDGNARR